jgi:hypothetical protein
MRSEDQCQERPGCGRCASARTFTLDALVERAGLKRIPVVNPIRGRSLRVDTIGKLAAAP